MLKRLIAVCLAVALLLPVLLHPVSAAEDKQTKSLRKQVIAEAKDSYLKSLASAGQESFHGMCGQMVSHQLYHLGINKYAVSMDGRDQYDYYLYRTKTTGGRPIAAYGMEDYSLKEALNAVSSNGTRNVRNILVGFEWTNTEAGGQFGHVVLINGILDGKVYFVESFTFSVEGKIYNEGDVVECSIDSFVKYFNKWTKFDGLIHFGSGTYEEVCKREETALYVCARFDAELRTQPCVVGKWKCKSVRTVSAGERLYVTGLYWGDRGLYYRVDTVEGYGFIAAFSVALMHTDGEAVTLTDGQLPATLKPGEAVTLGGTVDTATSSLTGVELRILDGSDGQPVTVPVELDSRSYKLEKLSQALQSALEQLPQSTYTVELWATAEYPVAEGGNMTLYSQQLLLQRQTLVVTDMAENSRLTPQENTQQEQPADGWFVKDGSWYYYENGQPKTGWFTHMGLDYYLDDTGAAVTGWQVIGMYLRCFSKEGVMLRDCDKTYEGKPYRLDSRGVASPVGN